MALQVGAKAPNFKLFDSDKKEVSLKDFQGKNVLLLFFPLAFTGTCTTELCNTRDDIKSYENMNAQVLGISVDSLFALDKFKQEQKLNFPLLSDFNKKTSKAYQSYYADFVLGMKGVAKRSAFVIDAKGVIQYAEVLESAGDLPNFKAIKEALQAL
jgi:glutaredoxin-dependent peroxiredoxin